MRDKNKINKLHSCVWLSLICQRIKSTSSSGNYDDPEHLFYHSISVPIYSKI